MAVSMHVVWSKTEPGRVIYETHSIETVSDGQGVHATVNSNTHEVPLHSREHAESVAAEEGYELFRKGEAWESLPER
ncbi:hypothetical protein RKE29_20965 [Streptomyces sp. B1866]|uniref:hypothetical protein n=1 Tax=Streptomyces sp. B1866 TaxID=3075431 RepID=UPI00288DF7C0|nr:hypothetical protein [Streptomyces sp. B1866]MDT3399086.1 hypothetical protein [Streptomyces sp. B1866]